jgi:hypothetical protein
VIEMPKKEEKEYKTVKRKGRIIKMVRVAKKGFPQWKIISNKPAKKGKK